MLKSLRPVEIFMLEKLLSNEESLTDCVDSIFEEAGSFKHYNEYQTNDYQTNNDVDDDDQFILNQNKSNHLNASNVTDECLSKDDLIKSKKKSKILKRSISLPDLKRNNLEETKLINNDSDDRFCSRFYATNDEQMINDEIDASFKKITKRIKRCVSQLLVKKHLPMDLMYENNNFTQNEFNRTNNHLLPSCDQQTHLQYHNQPYLNINNHFSSQPQYNSNNNNLIASSSQQSNSLTSSPSSIDSYEINLALNAKGSTYISKGAKQVLHKLFVSISGIADQLQSNFACDLRQILKLVFILHTSTIDEADNASLEEAEEALESTNFSASNKTSNFEEMLNNSENLQLLFSTTLNAIENAQTSNSDDLTREENVDEYTFNRHHQDQDFNEDGENIYENNMFENYQNDFSNHQSSLNNSINHQEQATTNDDLTRFQPVWVPDESTSECTNCRIQFTLLRRRHHCR